MKENLDRLAGKMRFTYALWAPVYDAAHSAQTLGTDRIYRKMLASKLGLRPGDRVLDVATGTGLAGLEALAQEPEIEVIGVDANPGMLEQAEKNIRNRGAGSRFRLVEADITEIMFENDFFDAVMSAYGLGGVQDQYGAMLQIVRVAKHNARIGAVEMSTPPGHLRVKAMLHRYIVAPWVNAIWNFRDTDVEELLKRSGVENTESNYLGRYILGSSTLAHGTLKKQQATS